MTSMNKRRDGGDTKTRILEEAYREFCGNGYKGGDINVIVNKAGLTKGALYHYFKGKEDLADAVLDTIITERIIENWIKPLGSGANPIDVLQEITACPEGENGLKELQQLADQARLMIELSQLNAGFHRKVLQISDRLLRAIAGALRDARERDEINTDVVPEKSAAQILSFFIGGTMLSKSLPVADVYRDCREQLKDYLESMRRQSGRHYRRAQC